MRHKDLADPVCCPTPWVAMSVKRKVRYLGSWSLFLCPSCGRRARKLRLLEGCVVCWRGFVTPTVADLYFAGKMADGDLVRSPPIPA